MVEKDGGAVLYEKYLKGDHTALAELVECYGASLVLFINRYVNNLSVAEELMEDTFCDIVIKRMHFKGKSSFKTFLFAIAKNKASMYIRRLSRYGSVPLEDAEGELARLGSIEDSVIKEAEKRELWRAIGELSEDHKAVLQLIYFEDLSYDEAARVMKCSHSRIRNLAYRARLALKEELERGGFVYEGI